MKERGVLLGLIFSLVLTIGLVSAFSISGSITGKVVSSQEDGTFLDGIYNVGNMWTKGSTDWVVGKLWVNDSSKDTQDGVSDGWHLVDLSQGKYLQYESFWFMANTNYTYNAESGIGKLKNGKWFFISGEAYVCDNASCSSGKTKIVVNDAWVLISGGDFSMKGINNFEDYWGTPVYVGTRTTQTQQTQQNQQTQQQQQQNQTQQQNYCGDGKLNKGDLIEQERCDFGSKNGVSTPSYKRDSFVQGFDSNGVGYYCSNNCELSATPANLSKILCKDTASGDDCGSLDGEKIRFNMEYDSDRYLWQAELQHFASDGWLTICDEVYVGEVCDFKDYKLYVTEMYRNVGDLTKTASISYSGSPSTVQYYCNDSDGGKNYFEKGTTIKTTIDGNTGGAGAVVDKCDYNNDLLIEYYCNEYNSTLESVKYNCLGGCFEGRCLPDLNVTPPTPTEGVCGELIDYVKHPEESIYDWAYGNEVNLTLDRKVVLEESFPKTYFASWVNENSDRKVGDIEYLTYKISVYEPGFSAEDALWTTGLSWKSCHLGNIGVGKYYICRSVGEYRSIIWFKDNVLVVIDYNTYGLDYSEDDFENHLNRQDYIMEGLIEDINSINFDNDVEEYNPGWVNWRIASIVKDSMIECPSEVTREPVKTSYGDDVEYGVVSCKTEPARCPEYGSQTKTCVRNGEIIKKEEISCSPGICSGCYVPRWFEDNDALDNVCIPYGHRTEFTTAQGGVVRIEGGTDKTEDGFALSFINEDEAILEILRRDGSVYKTYNLREGQTQGIDFPDWDDEKSTYDAMIKILDINNKDNYLEIEIVQYYTRAAYCDIDGEMKAQKLRDGNEWASCQNNYECVSNICSYGECVDARAVLEDVSAVKSLVYRVLCRLGNLFNEVEYNQCLVDFLGDTESTSSSSGGSDGGSSSSSGTSSGGGSGGSSGSPISGPGGVPEEVQDLINQAPSS